jgi:hypothetical protein
MEKTTKQLTSVKLDPVIFEEFKVNAIKLKFSFQKLSERAIYLYNTDPEFRKMIHGVKIDFDKKD